MKYFKNRNSLAAVAALSVMLFTSVVSRGEYEFSTVGGSPNFSVSHSVASDTAGNTYVVDSGNNTIWKISSGGVVTPFAGAAGMAGSSDGSGTNARFDFPQGVAVDSSGYVYVADTGNNTIRKISPSGLVTTLAGTSGGGSGMGFGSADGIGSNAAFHLPYGVAVDSYANVYVADTFNHTIRKITPTGMVSTVAGTAGANAYLDESGIAARFAFPRSIAIDSAGNLFIADSANHVIRKISNAGLVTTLAGLAGSFGKVDGTAASAKFAFPHGVATDSADNLYVADTSNNSIRKVTPAGVVTTLAGASNSGNVDGVGSVVRFNYPDGLAVDGAGILYVADSGNASIRRGVSLQSLAAAPIITTQPLSKTTVVGGAVTFIVTANGLPAPTLQWRKNGINIIGATGNSYTLSSILKDDAGTYSAVATNSTGSAVSSGAILTVPVLPKGNFSTDFNGDGQTDILWQNAATGQRALWLMNGIVGGFTPASIVDLGYVDTNWVIAGTGDFNRNSQVDILWQNTATGQRALWLMNGINSGFTPASIVNLGYVATDWSIAGTGDFNNDGQTDILWQNTVTGQRALWLMNGINSGFTAASIVNLGYVVTDWSIAGTGDFNNDGQTDILWQNTVTGQRALWLMNGINSGFTPASIVDLGLVSLDWLIAGTGDFNSDAQADIMWQNAVTGQRALWLMNGINNGFTPLSVMNLGHIDTNWIIVK